MLPCAVTNLRLHEATALILLAAGLLGPEAVQAQPPAAGTFQINAVWAITPVPSNPHTGSFAFSAQGTVLRETTGTIVANMTSFSAEGSLSQYGSGPCNAPSITVNQNPDGTPDVSLRFDSPSSVETALRFDISYRWNVHCEGVFSHQQNGGEAVGVCHFSPDCPTSTPALLQQVGPSAYVFSGTIPNRPGTTLIVAARIDIGSAPPNECLVALPSWKQFDPPWNTHTYDHTNRKVKDIGCGITSLAMVAKFAGYDTDPGRLNKIFIDDDPHGYRKPGGAVFWPHIATVSGQKLNVVRIDSFSLDMIKQEVCSQRPIIVDVKRNGKQHFVVVKGFKNGEYLIEDPGDLQNSTLSAYGNTGNGVRKVIVPGASPDALSTQAAVSVGQLQIDAPLGWHILLRDSRGARAGSLNGSVVFREIPGSTYQVEGLADDDESDSSETTSSESLSIDAPTPGTFHLTVTRSTGPADGAVSIHRRGASGQPLELLEQRLQLPLGTSTTIPFTYSTLDGDLNSDGVLDGLDLLIVRKAVGSQRGGLNWNPVADANGDAVVSAQELAQAMAVPFPAALSATSDGAAFAAGSRMTIIASLASGSTQQVVDAYIVFQIPGGQFLSLQINGGLKEGIVPLATGVTTFDIEAPVVSYSFTGVEPKGTYTLYSALTAPGTLRFVSPVKVSTFEVK